MDKYDRATIDEMACQVCHRLHGVDEPCPMRIARAETMQLGGLEGITEADREWLRTHNISVIDMVEEDIADMMS